MKFCNGPKLSNSHSQRNTKSLATVASEKGAFSQAQIFPDWNLLKSEGQAKDLCRVGGSFADKSSEVPLSV